MKNFWKWVYTQQARRFGFVVGTNPLMLFTEVIADYIESLMQHIHASVDIIFSEH